jgi:hypothetical protein
VVCQPAGVSVASATVTCSGFFATGTANKSDGFVGVRVWVGSAFGPALIDSFSNVGAPTYYAPVNSTSGAYTVSAVFTAQPAGTTLIARVYGAPTNAFGSWDQGTIHDTTVVCQPPGVSVTAAGLTCSTFTATGAANTSDGFVGVRVWVGSVGGTALIDSFLNVGAPTSYAPVNSTTGAYSVNASFTAQPAGTTLIARVYGAPTNAFGSWDQGTFHDTTVVCQPAGAFMTSATLTCSRFAASGTGNPALGFAAMRVWTVGIGASGGTPLIDSYINEGVPAVYAPISSAGTYNTSASFPLQAPGTTIDARIYRAPTNAFGSWDGQHFQDVTLVCPSPTLTPSTPSGSPFQTIVVSGTNFGPSESVKVFWDSTASSPLATTTALGNGSFAVGVTVPQAISGTHTLIAVGQTSGRTARALFQVKPFVILSPTSGKAGATETLFAVGFPAGETVAAVWFPGFTLQGTGTTNAVGTAVVPYTVPSVAPGSYFVIGYGITSKAYAFAPFTVLPPVAQAGTPPVSSATPPPPPYDLPVK